METIKCTKCGCVMGAASEACPACGEPVPMKHNIVEQAETIQNEASSLQTQDQPYQELQPKLEYNWDDKPKRRSSRLKVVLAFVSLVVLAGAGWLLYDSTQKQAELDRQLAIQQEQARIDSIATVELCEQAKQDSIIEAKRQLELKRQAYLRVLSRFQSGDYFLYDITGDGVPELWLNVYEDDGSSWQIHHLVDNQLILIHHALDGVCYKGNDGIIIDFNSGYADDNTYEIHKVSYHDGKILDDIIDYDIVDEYHQHKGPSFPKVKTYDIKNTKPIIESIE